MAEILDQTATVDPAKDGQEHGIDVKSLVEEIQQIKRAQAGSDKAYQEAAKKAAQLEKENAELKMEKMTEKQKAEFEAKQMLEEAQKAKHEAAEAMLNLAKIKILGEKNIPVDFSTRIIGSTEDELRADADTFNKQIDKLVGERVEKRLLTSKPPNSAVEVNTESVPGSLAEANAKYRSGIIG